MAKYRDVKIPEEMFLHIRKLIDKNPELGIRSGTSSLDLTIPVSIVKQLDIQPGELFSVKFEGKKNEEFELTYRRVIIERKK